MVSLTAKKVRTFLRQGTDLHSVGLTPAPRNHGYSTYRLRKHAKSQGVRSTTITVYELVAENWTKRRQWTVKQCAGHLEVSVSTIERAYQELNDAGLITNGDVKRVQMDDGTWKTLPRERILVAIKDRSSEEWTEIRNANTRARLDQQMYWALHFMPKNRSLIFDGHHQQPLFKDLKKEEHSTYGHQTKPNTRKWEDFLPLARQQIAAQRAKNTQAQQ